jgi:hypothetical protein
LSKKQEESDAQAKSALKKEWEKADVDKSGGACLIFL